MQIKRINLTLQGGGAHGAYTWGVLDRLLHEERRGVLLADAAEERLTPEGRAELGERGHAAKRLGFADLANAMLAVT